MYQPTINHACFNCFDKATKIYHNYPCCDKQKCESMALIREAEQEQLLIRQANLNRYGSIWNT